MVKFVNLNMNVQYLSDDKGQIKAVQVAIEDWERLKLVHPDIINIGADLPDWQKELIDTRLSDIKANPSIIKPISGLLELLDREA